MIIKPKFCFSKIGFKIYQGNHRHPQQYKNVTMKFKDIAKTKYNNTLKLFIK